MFLYFIPNETEDTFRDAASFAPLTTILRDALPDLKTKSLRGGPADTEENRVPGLLICALPADRTFPIPLRYEPARQTWKDCGGYWMGYVTESPPHPETLQRDKTLDGYTYVLGDGREYLCPIVRRMLYKPMLPCGMHFNGETFERQVKPDWEEIWNQSANWSKRMNDHDRATAAVTCLQINYRVGPFEIDVLGAFSDETAVNEIILAALDEQFFIDCMNDPKKKASVEAMLSAWEKYAALYEASFLDTPQAGESLKSSEQESPTDAAGG